MARGVALEDIHPAVEAGFNAQDADALVALYEPDATLVMVDGTTVTGTEAIREQYVGMLQFGGRMAVRSRYAIEAGDLAVLSNEWTYTVGDESMSAVTAEVARRQPDGGWLYVVDHPFASLEAEERAALEAAIAG
ncbi:YybH family protein [Geodermatophilus sp. SYSU D00708]